MSHAEERPSRGRDAGEPAGRTEGENEAPNVSEAVQQAKRAASSLAADANRRIAGLLDRQVSAGADIVGHVAASVRAAADSLDESEPQVADFARVAADHIEDVSEAIRDQSASDLFDTASDFARRRPAVVFGVAAVAGFLLYRVLSAAPPSRAVGARPARRAPARKPARRTASASRKTRRPSRGA